MEQGHQVRVPVWHQAKVAGHRVRWNTVGLTPNGRQELYFHSPLPSGYRSVLPFSSGSNAPNRDPRLDPQAGDVVHGNGQVRRVMKRERDRARCASGHYDYRMLINNWRKWCTVNGATAARSLPHHVARARAQARKARRRARHWGLINFHYRHPFVAVRATG